MEEDIKSDEGTTGRPIQSFIYNMNRSVLPLNPFGYLGRKIGGGGGRGSNREETKDQLAILDQGVRVIVVGRVVEVRYLKRNGYVYWYIC